MNIQDKEQIEIDFWKHSPIECPESDSLDNLVMKFSEARVFLEKIDYYKPLFQHASSVLELGGGQGWASCMVKRLFPHLRITLSDISEYAIASISKWESILQVTVDAKVACRSYEVPIADESVDLIFCFEAAHHFIKHRRTLQEIQRVLKPGGTCLYLHEPACKPYLYKAAYDRVNRKRPVVPEDVLIYPKITELARQAGLQTTLRFDPSTLNRGTVETFYYFALQKIPGLREWLPCSVDFSFRKV
jgi:ubiquinone/menaquinone biosynthesis C-methylase UbiE